MCDEGYFLEWYEEQEEMADGGCTSRSGRYLAEKHSEVCGKLRCEAVVEDIDFVEDLEGFQVDLPTGE